MEGVVLVLAGLVLVALPGLLRPLGRRLAPCDWARLCAAALAGGAGVFELGLLVYAAPTVLSAVGVPALASACQRMISGVAPGGAAAGSTAGALAVAVAALAGLSLTRGRRIRRSARVEPWLGEHHALGSHELVVLAGEKLVAFSVGGDQGQVVVSAGLVETLSQEEFDVVVAHEVAHLDHGHDRYVALASAVQRALVFSPLATRSVASLRVALERWADEDAVAAIEDGRDRLRRALLQVTVSMIDAEVAAFSAADAVLERLDALEIPPPGLGTGLLGLFYIPGFAVGIASVAGLGAWVSTLQMVLQMAGRCPL